MLRATVRKRLRKRMTSHDNGGSILVVDDDASVRTLLTELLSDLGKPVRAASSGPEAVASLDAGPPALMVLDINLPGLSGYEVCRRVKDRFGGETPVLFISGERTEPFDRAAGLLVGADDYVVKPFEPGELIARARRLLARSDARADAPHVDGAKLTRRELQVLGLLGQGLNQKQIARELVISSKTVATHIQRILTKLKVHSRAQAVALAHRSGLLERP
jgi:DNA-binding NarL/FixJ family response regulator